VNCVNGVLPLAPDLQKIPTLTVVAAALVDGSGRVLLQQRAPGRAMAGLWEFPGGKVEAGERPEAALARELEEELGIHVDEDSLEPATFASADNAGRHMILLLYLCRQWRGECRPLDAAELRWVLPAEMTALPMPPADAPLIPLLEKLI
jgi:8-oxo-dGTP diphosphatase